MKQTYRYACAAGIALVISTPSFAQNTTQSGAETTPDIVVTAQRREQRLQDVPLSVTALDSETLRTNNISSVGDLGTGRVPGLAVGSMFGSQTSVYLNFRGLASSDPSQGTQDSPAAFYIDGVNVPRAQGMALELITPERIEVLRGPQGQLFGRNAEGGAVQVVSRRPRGRLRGDFTAGIGEFATHYARGSLDLPSLGGFDFQLSGFWREHHGYIKNISNPLLHDIVPLANPGARFVHKRGDYDQDFNPLKSYGGRIAVAKDFGIGDMFYSYDNTWVKENQGYTNFVNAPAIPGTLNNPTGVNTPSLLFTLQPGLVIFSQSPLDFDHYPKRSDYSNYMPDFITKSQGHNLTLTFPVADNLTLKSITGYRKVVRGGHSFLSVAVSVVNPGSYEYVNSKTFSQEFQALYTSSRLDVTAGLIYFNEKVLDQRDSFFAINCGILGPVVTACTPNGQPTRPQYINSFYPPGFNDFKSQTSKTKAYAAYAQATYTPPILNDMLELTAGIRYSNDTKRGERTVTNGATLPVPLRNEAKADRFDPAFSAKLKLSRDVNIYARFARGFRDGGANVRSEIFSAFAPDTLTSYEVGLKSQFLDRRVTLNVAAYHNTLKDYQLQVQTDPAVRPGVGDTVNLPFDIKIKGIEAELTIRPVDGLTLSASGSYIDAPDSYLLGIEALGPTTLRAFIPQATYSPVTGLIPSAATLAAHPNSSIYGGKPTWAPKWSYSLGGDYSLPVHDEITFNIHADWTHTTDFPTAPIQHTTTITGGVATPLPFYNYPASTDRVNMRVAVSDIPLGGAKAELSFWVQNLFNTVRPAFTFASGNGINAASQATQSTIYLAPPRVLGGELRVEF